jgi:hypothetical protein
MRRVTSDRLCMRPQFVIHRVGNIDVGQEVAGGIRNRPWHQDHRIETIVSILCQDYDRMTKLVPSDYK